jgi:hypothetical protein
MNFLNNVRRVVRLGTGSGISLVEECAAVFRAREAA